MDKIIIFLVIRNESEYIIEWLQYHFALGVDLVIVLDDDSNDDTYETLKPFIELNLVHYFKDGLKSPLCSIPRTKYYNMYREKYHNSIMIYIDIDEFIYVKDNSLRVLLDDKLQIKNNYINETRCIRKTKQNSFNLFNKNIYKIKSPVTSIKPIIKINREIVPNFINSHQINYDNEKSKPINFNISYVHIKFYSMEEEQKKLTKYKKELCNHYYKNKIELTKYYNNIKLLGPPILNNLSIQNYSEIIFKKFYCENGFLFIPNFFDKTKIDEIFNDAKNIYKSQMIELNLIKNTNISDQEFEYNLKILFNKHFNIFINCGKQCQHIINLWKLSLNDKLIYLLKILGIKTPHISTRPVLFSNSKHIAKNKINHTVPPQQDWASMQGSINSIVVWIPLIDLNKDLGSIEIIPKSHKEGLLSKEKEGSFGLVENYEEKDFISFDVKQGDIILFNSFLVHKTGNNITDNIRWSCHMRYNDLDDNSFIKRGYPHAYIYKPIDEYLTPDFNTKKEINDYLNNI